MSWVGCSANWREGLQFSRKQTGTVRKHSCCYNGGEADLDQLSSQSYGIVRVYYSYTPIESHAAVTLIPWSLVLQPFSDATESEAPATTHVEDIDKCKKCGSYINSYATLVDNTWKFVSHWQLSAHHHLRCPLCRFKNDFSEAHSRYALLDRSKLPELSQHGAVYQIDPNDSPDIPTNMMPIYIALIDVTCTYSDLSQRSNCASTTWVFTICQQSNRRGHQRQVFDMKPHVTLHRIAW